MNHTRILSKTLALIAMLSVTPAWAWGGHGGGGHWGGSGYWGHGYGYRGFYGGPSVGFYFGPGYGWPYYPYYYPYPAYPPTVVTAPASPPVYIEQRGAQSSSPPASNLWYYCRNPNGYYPYVKECPGGWQKVAPEPPDR